MILNINLYNLFLADGIGCSPLKDSTSELRDCVDIVIWPWSHWPEVAR